MRETHKELINFLAEMVKNRNRIAHTAGSATDISLKSLKLQLKFVNAFVMAFAEHIETGLPKPVAVI